MKRSAFRFTVVIALLLCVLGSGLTASAEGAAEIEPMYTGIVFISSDVSISSKGVITCTGRVLSKNGYTAKVTWELQSGTNRFSTMSTWNDSGADVKLNTTRSAIRGYNYRLKISVKAYNSKGTLVDDEVAYSNIAKY